MTPPDRFFHGAIRDFEPGQLAEPGHPPNYAENPREHVYFSTTAEEAADWAADAAEMHGNVVRPRVYEVRPTGEYERDPDGESHLDLRSRHPLVIVGEAHPDPWEPEYSQWERGWYVDNICYPGGERGNVSLDYPDLRWRIVKDGRPDAYAQFTYGNRDSAAREERQLARARWERVAELAAGLEPVAGPGTTPNAIDAPCAVCGAMVKATKGLTIPGTGLPAAVLDGWCTRAVGREQADPGGAREAPADYARHAGAADSGNPQAPGANGFPSGPVAGPRPGTSAPPASGQPARAGLAESPGSRPTLPTVFVNRLQKPAPRLPQHQVGDACRHQEGTSMPNVATSNHPLAGTEQQYLPAGKVPSPDANTAPSDYRTVVRLGDTVTVLDVYENWNGVSGLTMAYVYVHATGYYTHLSTGEMGITGSCGIAPLPAGQGTATSPTSTNEAVERAKAPAARTPASQLAGSSFPVPVQSGSDAAPPDADPRQARQNPLDQSEARRRSR